MSLHRTGGTVAYENKNTKTHQETPYTEIRGNLTKGPLARCQNRKCEGYNRRPSCGATSLCGDCLVERLAQIVEEQVGDMPDPADDAAVQALIGALRYSTATQAGLERKAEDIYNGRCFSTGAPR